MITQKHPIVTLRSELGEIPRIWLDVIEPKLSRDFLPCWMWQGTMDKNNYAMIYDKRTGKLCTGARWMMKIFYDFPDNFWVHKLCTWNNCLNPKHYVISELHPRAFDASAYRSQLLA